MTDIAEKIKELDALEKKATPCKDVEAMWYGGHVQFEGERGQICFKREDYEYLAALRNAWPQIRMALSALEHTEQQRGNSISLKAGPANQVQEDR